LWPELPHLWGAELEKGSSGNRQVPVNTEEDGDQHGQKKPG